MKREGKRFGVSTGSSLKKLPRKARHAYTEEINQLRQKIEDEEITYGEAKQACPAIKRRAVPAVYASDEEIVFRKSARKSGKKFKMESMD
eukprot:CAMPEP_0115021320 /NCGR_PEP_ID=MMETSP0216-20121206/30813_1 /TAXON_ID=223996 /ORGANISM="Protocruzia adherens, Strain Boccale" /LENGTH=89 /DNA_ID=CAMNT_0002393647 /DNA_START=587 /DNA_END=856 /DNA_ORIENTATION=-